MTSGATMRVAVVGGTGLVGRHTVDALHKAGHQPIVVARSRGVDVLTGQGLDEAMAGVESVIDVINLRDHDLHSTRTLFETATRHLLEAERRAGVKHHVLLSIVSVDRIPGLAHYAGKRAQEALLLSGPIPATIQRATQFHEFAGMVVNWVRQGEVAVVPPLLLQPVAAADVGDVLAEIALGDPQGRAPDLAGPDLQDLVDMARRTLAAWGESIRLIPSWRNNLMGVEAAGEAFLPGPDARLAPTTFEAWLQRQARST